MPKESCKGAKWGTLKGSQGKDLIFSFTIVAKTKSLPTFANETHIMQRDV